MNFIAKAAENLKGNWHQGSYIDMFDKRNMCGIGHVAVASGKYDAVGLNFNGISITDDNEVTKAVKILGEIVLEQFPDRVFYENFVGFNDHSATTEDEVVMVLEKAAVKFDEMV